MHFTKYMRELDMRKPVIWTGDLNVAPTELGESRAAYCVCIFLASRSRAAASLCSTVLTPARGRIYSQ